MLEQADQKQGVKVAALVCLDPAAVEALKMVSNLPDDRDVRANQVVALNPHLVPLLSIQPFATADQSNCEQTVYAIINFFLNIHTSLVFHNKK